MLAPAPRRQRGGARRRLAAGQLPCTHGCVPAPIVRTKSPLQPWRVPVPTVPRPCARPTSAATAWSAAQARQRRSGPVCPALSSGPAPLALPPRLAAVQAVRAVAAVLRCSARQAGGASTRGASATVMLAAAGGWALCAPSLALTPQPPPLLFHSGSAAWGGPQTAASPALTQAIALCKWSPTAHWAVAAG